VTFRVHPLSRTTHVVATWPGLEDLAAVFDAWQRHAPRVDDRLTSQLEVTFEEVTLSAVLVAGSEAEARRLLDPMLRIGHPDVVATNAEGADRYAAFQIPLDEEAANWKFTSQFVLEPFPARAIDLLVSSLSTAPPGCNYFTDAFGGAVATGRGRSGGDDLRRRRASTPPVPRSGSTPPALTRAEPHRCGWRPPGHHHAGRRGSSPSWCRPSSTCSRARNGSNAS
jgi:hypothetical protein